MGMYFELWKILWKWKGKNTFSIKEFREMFSSSSPKKVLYDMNKLGYLERVKRNEYKVVSPDEIVRMDFKKIIENSYKLLKEGGLKYALANGDAVLKWTKGGYTANKFFGFYPIYVKIKKQDLKKWKKFLKKHKKKFYIKDEKIKGTYFSVFFVLIPKEKFKAEKLEGDMVIPLEETVKFCKRNRASFEHALEMLDRMYDLGLKVKYSVY